MPILFEKLSRFSLALKLAVVMSIVFAGSVVARDKIVIAVSFAPYANMVQAIGGDEVEVVTLLPPGTDMRYYKPQPKEIKEFSLADVYLTDGSGVDRAWLPRFKQVKQTIKIVDISEGIVWLAGEGNEPNPYLWLSPKQMAKISTNIRVVLSKLRPERDSYFVAKHVFFLRKLNQVDDELEAAVRRLPKDARTFIATRPLFTYLAQDYDLQPQVVEVSGKVAKSKDVKKIVELGRKIGAKMVFVPPQFDKLAVESFKRDFGAKVVEVNFLTYDFLDNAKSMANVINEIAAALRKDRPTLNLPKPKQLKK